MLLYDVSATQATALLVSVASVSGHRVGAIVGLKGRAAEWANRLGSGVPDHFVPDAALSPGGSLTVAYA